MNNRKGMSQTLALIVAASVLMMTALTVIFLAQGSLGNFGEDAGKRGCASSLQATKTTMSAGDTARIPDNCFTADGQPIDVAGYAVPGSSDGPGDQMCLTSSGDLQSGTTC